MSGNFIANTPRHQMHALAFQGIMVTDCYPQLCDMLRRKFGDAYVLLFAEPVPNAGSQSVDWYTPVQGAARRLTDLPADEQNTVRDALVHMAKELHTFADELKKAAEHTKTTRGNILDLALSYPNEDCLYVVGEQPVITCWGFGPGTPGAEPQDLSRITHVAAPAAAAAPAAPAAQTEKVAAEAVPPAAASTPEPVAGPTSGCSLLWWLLPLLLLLVLLWLLFTSFGSRPALSGRAFFTSPLPPFCRPVVTPQHEKLASLETEAAKLESDIATLNQRLAEHVARCVPEKAQEEKPVAPAPSEEKPLVIPAQPEDMSFLQGYWRCETGLVNHRTREPVVVEFEFGADGTGTGRIFEQNNRCAGNAHGEMLPNGELRIVLEEQKCGNGSVYTRQEILCGNSGGSSHCQGRNVDDGSSWDARFLKKR